MRSDFLLARTAGRATACPDKLTGSENVWPANCSVDTKKGASHKKKTPKEQLNQFVVKMMGAAKECNWKHSGPLKG